MSDELTGLSVLEAGKGLRAAQFTSVELTQACLSQIERWEPHVKAFITLTAEPALAQAQIADSELARSVDRGPLHGIPFGIKDIFDTNGVRTTCGSKLLVDNIPTKDSTVGRRLTEAGGILLGKLNTYEFAIGDREEDLPFPPSLNPWKLDRITPGSSSGSAVAIATGMMRIATGSDTGGSIRLPAACCGVVGLKPTFGRVSRHGVFPFSHSCDHAGILTKTVEDMAVGLQVIAGHDPLDPVCVDRPVPTYLDILEGGVVGARIGVDWRFIEFGGMEESMARAFGDLLSLLQDMNATIADVIMPKYEAFSACAAAIISVEGLSVHQQTLSTRPDILSPALKRSFIPAIAVSALDYVQAQRLRRDLAMDINAQLAKVDVILCLVSRGGAVPYDPIPDSTHFGRTIPFNITGHPAMSIPIAEDHEGMPLAVQIVGRPFDEATVLRVGRAIEHAASWSGGTPKFPPRQ